MATNDGSTGRPPGTLPDVFGRYRVLRELGRGGMGTVYLVENTELEREEALKVPRFEADDAQARERFLREARLAAKLDHPNLCQVFHVGVQDGVYFLTMRYLQGRPLSAYTGQALPPRKAVEIVARLTQALEYAHGKGVIHRDLKPSNVMMCAGLGPVVMDFGLAKQLRQSDQKLTHSGVALGTPAYMPPEQLMGELERIGPASDVYSLGVILYELLTGQPPFKGSVAELMIKILHAEAPPPSALQPGLSPVLDAICRTALAKAPEGRYVTMKAFGAAVGDYLRSTSATESMGTLAPAKADRADIPQAAAVLQSPTRGPSVPTQGHTRPGAGDGADATRGGQPWRVLVGILGCLGLLLVVGVLIGLRMGGFAGLSVSANLAETSIAPHRPLPGADPATSRTSPAETKRSTPSPPPVADTGKGVAVARPALLDWTRVEEPNPELKNHLKAQRIDVQKAQEAWAKYLGRQVEETVEVADGVTMTFVLVPPGTFRMGSPVDEKDRWKVETLHEVTLTEPFDLGKTEVTQAQYQALTGDNPSHFKGADLPVESVSWEQARDYAARLTKRRGDQHRYRLPTEAEWEYSCRGGRPCSHPFGVGDGRALSSSEANFDGPRPYGGADEGPYLKSTCRVGSYPANALGLFDMHGNVCEWCADWYGPYPQGAVTNPTGPSEGSGRVYRGGSWSIGARCCRAAYRTRSELEQLLHTLGFRLARTVPPGGQ
jgi:formylglycine-generating enzyme required for sulfatase activity/predicted Ser/Thr protein kinase